MEAGPGKARADAAVAEMRAQVETALAMAAEGDAWLTEVTTDLEALETFLESKGIPSRHARPVALPVTHDELDDYHVIVNLGTGLRDHLAERPFKTVLPAGIWPRMPSRRSQ